MKLKKLPKFMPRNTVATSALLKKSGVHLSETAPARNKKSRSLAKNSLKGLSISDARSAEQR